MHICSDICLSEIADLNIDFRLNYELQGLFDKNWVSKKRSNYKKNHMTKVGLFANDQDKTKNDIKTKSSALFSTLISAINLCRYTSLLFGAWSLSFRLDCRFGYQLCKVYWQRDCYEFLWIILVEIVNDLQKYSIIKVGFKVFFSSRQFSTKPNSADLVGDFLICRHSPYYYKLSQLHSSHQCLYLVLAKMFCLLIFFCAILL